MYFFTMYNLSGIQKGIQAGHAALEYANKWGYTQSYKDFIENYKTFIVLDGGTSSTMIDREQELERFGVTFASFQEPDLNNSVSAIAFLVPENIYDADIYMCSDENGNYNGYCDPSFTEEDFNLAKYLKGFRLASN